MRSIIKDTIKKIKDVHVLLIILLLQVINLLYYFLYLNEYSYLPAPFVTDKNDSLMDFYNPLFWVLKNEFYTTFKSVYPPLNYYILKIFTLGINADDVLSAFQMRQDYPAAAFVVTLIYLFIIWLVVNLGEWKKYSSNKNFIYLTLIFSIPVIFGIERGNLIFLSLLFLALYLNTSNLWAKAIFLGMLINIKPYFIILLVLYLNIHQFNVKELLRTIFTSAIIFFGLGIFTNIDFLNFFASYVEFSKNTTISVEGAVALPHSIAALSLVKKLILFPEGSRYTFWFSLLKVINYITVLTLIFFTITRNLSKPELLISSFLILTNFSISTGGYILIIYIIIIPYLLSSSEYKKFLFLIFIMCVVPWDWINLIDIKYTLMPSYLGGNTLIYDPTFHIGFGTIVRPITNFFMMAFYLKHITSR